MFYEYALDPTVLSSWDRTRFFLDAFGPWKGRFLAEFPRKWKRMVIESLSCPDVERARIVERLRELDKRVFSARSPSAYDGKRTWLENAAEENQRERFRAIIATQSTLKDADNILDASAVDDQSEGWRVETGRLMSRDPVAFRSALALLLQASRHVVIVDPYFRADQTAKTASVMALLNATRIDAKLEVHFSSEGDKQPSQTYNANSAQRTLPDLLPAGREVELRCWRKRVGGPRLHNRYLLTDVGGVQFGDGIEAGGPGEEDRVSILDESSHERLWKQYVETPAFDAVGAPTTIVGARRSP